MLACQIFLTSETRLLYLLHPYGSHTGFAAFTNALEEIVALVVDQNEGGEVYHFDFPNGFHAQLFIFNELHFLILSCARMAAGPPMEPR